MKKNITILGAGLVGSLLAILLRKRNYPVTIIERRPDMRKGKVIAGRSINLAMSVRGWKALEIAGLREAIEEIAIPMYGRQIHQPNGERAYQAYGKNNEAIYSVSRGELNKKLMDLAEDEGAHILFGKRVTDVDIDTNIIRLENTDSGVDEVLDNNECIISADGAFSALRNAYLKRDKYNYHQFYIEHGYKELHIPPLANNEFALEKEALHIWPRKNFMLIALPNIDGSFTCTLFFPFEGPISFQSLKTDADIAAFFEEYFADVIPVMPSYIEDYKSNPTSSLITVKCSPWTYSNKNMLIGDAAHAIVPFFGQGMNAGFEDCRILAELLDSHESDDWIQLFSKYEESRKINGDAVADLALQNFIEMRDLVADPVFLEGKRIEKELGKMFPGIFNSVYEMVSFSHTPYSVALQQQKAQLVLLEKIMQAGNFDTNVLKEDFKLQLNSWMQEYASEISRKLQKNI